MTARAEYICYTDGSCKAGEGAPGGYGFVVRAPTGESLEGHGSAAPTLAKTMEYRAVAEALDALPSGAKAVVFSDNQPLVMNLTKQLPNWRIDGFAKVDPEIAPSVRRIDACIQEKSLVVRFEWIRAHNGNAGNERADALAALGAREAKARLRGIR